MLSLVVVGGVRRCSATRVAMLVLSAAGLAGVLGLMRRGQSISDEVCGGAMASGDSTIDCGGDECASGVTPLVLNVRSCTVSWKFTLGACGWGLGWIPSIVHCADEFLYVNVVQGSTVGAEVV
jgi:hypothetical protein